MMSATADAVQLEAREKRDMLDVVERLKSGIHSVSTAATVTPFGGNLMHASPVASYVHCGHTTQHRLFGQQLVTCPNELRPCSPCDVRIA